MKLLHTSDWHLGKTNASRSMMEDQKFFIDAICEIISSENIDAVLLAGDVYDRSLASPEAIKLYDYAMNKIVGEKGVTVFTIAGNHDSGVRLAANSNLLKNCGLYVSGVLTAEIESVEFGDVQIFLLPWFTADKVRTLFPESAENIKSLTDAYSFICDKIRGEFKKDKKHIVISHSFIVGAETSTSDRSAEVGLAGAVNAGVFEGFDYVALGHIHKPQNVDNNKYIRYSGTPMPYSFGKEETQQKSVTIIDTQDMSVSQIPLKPFRLRKTLRGTLDEILQNEYPEEIINAYLRIELTDSVLGMDIIGMLNEKFPNIIEYSGKSYDDADSSITLSVEELERMENNPTELFKQFCTEMLKQPPNDHIIKMFESVLDEYMKGEDAQ